MAMSDVAPVDRRWGYAAVALLFAALATSCGLREFRSKLPGPKFDGGLAGDADANSGAPTGAACDEAAGCAGDVCLNEVAGRSYPDGYCSTEECREGGCPADDAVCVEVSDGTARCLDGCTSPDDCREGYSCRDAGSNDGRACRPGPPPPADSFEQSRSVLDVQCDPTETGSSNEGTEYRFAFTLGESSNAFAMVPYVRSGQVRPTSLETPNGTLDLVGQYRHQNTRLMDAFSAGTLAGVGTFGKVAFDWPITVPYAPKFREYVEPGGSYELQVTSTREEPCLYVLENRPGETLDVNFYVLGLKDGLSAEEAEKDPDLQKAIEWMRRLYGKIGVELGQLRFFELSPELEEEYRRIRSREEAYRLTAHGTPPTRTLSGHLSVDVFLVKDLQVGQSDQGDVLGISAGIPGAAGLHGHARNGLIFQTVDLGASNKHVGLIMAHEIAHFLGLRHTTEIVHDTSRADELEDRLGTTDPIEDTQVCSNIFEKLQDGRYDQCGDFDNLMFPVAPPPQLSQDSRLTDGQGAAMKANPLVTSK